MAEKPKSETTNVPPTSQELPPQRANSTRMTGDPQRRYREKVEKNQEYQEIISKRKSRIEAARSVSAATTSLLSPLRDFGVGSSAPPMGLLIAPASVGSSMVSTPQMGSPVPREDRQRHRENGVEQPPPPQSILKTDGRTRHPEMASSPTDSSLERENLEEIQPRTTAAPITRTNSTPKDESFEVESFLGDNFLPCSMRFTMQTAARYNDAQLGAATGRNRRKELTPDVSVITAESKLGVTRSKSYGVNETNRTRLANREEYEDRDYDYDAPMPPR